MLHLLIRININGQRLLSHKPFHTLRARRRRQRSSICIHTILGHIVRHLVEVKPPSPSDSTRLLDSGKVGKDLVQQSGTAVRGELKDLPDDSDGVVSGGMDEMHFEWEGLPIDAVLAWGVEVKLLEGVGCGVVHEAPARHEHFDGRAEILECGGLDGRVVELGACGALEVGELGQDDVDGRLEVPCCALGRCKLWNLGKEVEDMPLSCLG